MLEEQLIDSIKEQGALTFEAYMKQCLYHEDYGYYASNTASIGQSGDFSTSISIGGLFGQLIAERLYQLWQTLPQPQQAWSIFEIGAFHGQLALDILNHLQATYADCYQACHYTIIEPFAKLQEQQQATLKAHEYTHWFKEAQQATRQPRQGIILSNELFDALPVERLIYQNEQWQLIGIDYINGEFSQTQLPINKSPYADEIEAYLANITFEPVDGYELEFSPHMPTLVHDISSLIDDGHQLHIDYGFAQADLLHPDRYQGTLQAYEQQQVITDYLNKSGLADLSCHINFSQLKQAVENQRWAPSVFIDQSAYLTINAQSWFTQISMPPTDEQQALIKQFTTLTHPSIMGKKFWVFEATCGRITPIENPFKSLNKLHYLA